MGVKHNIEFYNWRKLQYPITITTTCERFLLHIQYGSCMANLMNVVMLANLFTNFINLALDLNALHFSTMTSK